MGNDFLGIKPSTFKKEKALKIPMIKKANKTAKAGKVYEPKIPISKEPKVTQTDGFFLPNLSAVKGADDKLKARGYTSGSVLFSDGENIVESNADFSWDNTNKRLGIGTTSPGAKLEIQNDNGVSDLIIDSNTGFDSALRFYEENSQMWSIRQDSDDSNKLKFYGNVGDKVTITRDGNVGIGTTSPASPLHVDQSSTTAAIPVLTLDQADISEEMIEFVTTIGTGNAIEAVGAKTLTTTHFIKVTLPGGLTRYIPAGTIA